LIIRAAWSDRAARDALAPNIRGRVFAVRGTIEITPNVVGKVAMI
jgi:hypothetical protein